jgi:hypothetical protein
MSAYTFVDETSNTSALVPWTGFADKKDGFPPTAVYLPRRKNDGASTVDVLVWFHGHLVSSARDLVRPADSGNDMNLRESVRDAKKDVIFVAPWLGLTHAMDLGLLGKDSRFQVYLDMVLAGIAPFQKSHSKSAPDSLSLGKLILACHSGGGVMMKAAAQHLGSYYDDNLKECWGFDCFYDDDYPDWSRRNPTPAKYWYVGDGSGQGGDHAFEFMKEQYGTPKKPIPEKQRIANTYLAYAVDKVLTTMNSVAFQPVIEDPDDWGLRRDVYSEVRRATDRYLDDTNASTYWSKLRPKLTNHFQVVRNLLGPRIKQSRWLQDA